MLQDSGALGECAPVVQTGEAQEPAVRYVELTCAREELLRRVVQPSRAAYDKVNDTDTRQGWLDKGRIKVPQLDRDGVLRIDNSALEPGEVARRIIAHFGLPTLR